MAITRVGVGAYVNGTSATLTAVAPAYNPGDTLLLCTGERAGSATISTPTGWTKMTKDLNSHQIQVFGLDALGGDTIPGITWGSGSIAWAVIVVYRGVMPVATAQDGTNWNDRTTASETRDIDALGSSFTPSVDGCLVFQAGQRNKTSTSDTTTFNTAPVNFTSVSSQVNAGTNTAEAFCEWIQGIATPFQHNTIVGTVADGAGQNCQNTIFTLKPAPVKPLGFVPRPGNPALSSPRNILQFRGVGREVGPAPVIAASLNGISVSTSVLYGATLTASVVGFVPQPGPGVGPFSNNQFLQSVASVSNPSPSTQFIFGVSISASVSYGAVLGAGALTGLTPVSSVAFGLASGFLAGSIQGLTISTSVAFGALIASATLNGVAVSSSVLTGTIAIAALSGNNASGGQKLSPNPNVTAFVRVGGDTWGANGGGGFPIGGGVSGPSGWDNPIAETISTAQRQANYDVLIKPVAAEESDTTLPTTTPDDSLPTGGSNAG